MTEKKNDPIEEEMGCRVLHPSGTRLPKVAVILQAVNRRRHSSVSEKTGKPEGRKSLPPLKLEDLLCHRLNRTNDLIEDKMGFLDKPGNATSKRHVIPKAVRKSSDVSMKNTDLLKCDPRVNFFMSKVQSNFKKFPNKSLIGKVLPPEKTLQTHASPRTQKFLPKPLKCWNLARGQTFRLSPKVEFGPFSSYQVKNDYGLKCVSRTYNLKFSEGKTTTNGSEKTGTYRINHFTEGKLVSNPHNKLRLYGFFIQKTTNSEKDCNSSSKTRSKTPPGKKDLQPKSTNSAYSHADIQHRKVVYCKAHLIFQEPTTPFQRIQSESKKDFLKKLVRHIMRVRSLGIPPEQIKDFPTVPYQHPRADEFIKAAKYGSTNKINEMSNEVSGLLVHQFDRCHQTALHQALQRGHVESARRLLELGSDINASDLFGRTPLYYAVSMLDRCLVLEFLIKGASPWASRSVNNRSLSKNNQEILSLLRKFRLFEALAEFEPKKNRENLKKYFLAHYLSDPNLEIH